MQPDDELSRKIAGIAALDQPLRRDLFRLLARAEGWTTRDEAAASLAVARSVAGFPTPRSVRQCRSGTTTSVADCLRTAARAAGELLGEEANAAVAGTRGRGARRQAVLDVLARHGCEPEVVKRNEIALANCPFHRLAEEHRELVCGMNLDFLEGLLSGMGPVDTLSARLAPAPGFCCVRIDAA
jgi:hypothetical protein